MADILLFLFGIIYHLYGRKILRDAGFPISVDMVLKTM